MPADIPSLQRFTGESGELGQFRARGLLIALRKVRQKSQYFFDGAGHLRGQ